MWVWGLQRDPGRTVGRPCNPLPLKMAEAGLPIQTSGVAASKGVQEPSKSILLLINSSSLPVRSLYDCIEDLQESMTLRSGCSA